MSSLLLLLISYLISPFSEMHSKNNDYHLDNPVLNSGDLVGTS